MDSELILSLLIGVGLSASVGFRIFVPALITSIAAHFNYVELAESMSWIGSVPAMVTLGVATVLELLGYY